MTKANLLTSGDLYYHFSGAVDGYKDRVTITFTASKVVMFLDFFFLNIS